MNWKQCREFVYSRTGLKKVDVHCFPRADWLKLHYCWKTFNFSLYFCSILFWFVDLFSATALKCPDVSIATTNLSQIIVCVFGECRRRKTDRERRAHETAIRHERSRENGAVPFFCSYPRKLLLRILFRWKNHNDFVRFIKIRTILLGKKIINTVCQEACL